MPTQIELLKTSGLKLKSSLGQNLLIDPNIQRKIVDLLAPKLDETILEIGPGLGAITGEILERGARVIAVEKDERFVKLLSTLGDRYELRSAYLSPKVPLRLLHEDFLDCDLNKIIPGRAKIKAVSNLPYYLTTPILFHLMKFRERISKLVVMMQKEVAARILAEPGTKDYGRLALAFRYAARVHRAFEVSRNCFTPKPEVDSTVLEIEFLPKFKLLKPAQEKHLFEFIQLAFSQRRKTLFSLLAHQDKIKLTRPYLEEVFNVLGLVLTVRAEELLLKDFIQLSERIK